MDLKSRTILLTGATSGIGTSLCQQLTAAGAHVLAVGRSQEKLDSLHDELPQITPIRCDLARKGDVIALSQRIKSGAYPVSILINNAAVQFTPWFTDIEFSFDSIETEIDTNFTAIAWLTSLLLPHLLEHPTGGAVVNMSSGLALHPKTSSAIYCATKAALHNLSQSLRYQLEDTDVRVIEVLLPLVDTPMTHGRGSDKLTPEYAARQTIGALQSDQDELFVGKARFLPLLSRIAPAIAKNILKSH